MRNNKFPSSRLVRGHGGGYELSSFLPLILLTGFHWAMQWCDVKWDVLRCHCNALRSRMHHLWGAHEVTRKKRCVKTQVCWQLFWEVKCATEDAIRRQGTTAALHPPYYWKDDNEPPCKNRKTSFFVVVCFNPVPCYLNQTQWQGWVWLRWCPANRCA